MFNAALDACDTAVATGLLNIVVVSGPKDAVQKEKVAPWKRAALFIFSHPGVAKWRQFK